MPYSYLSKDFKSQIVLNSKKYNNNHYTFNNLDEVIDNNNETIAYPDGVITSINSKNSKLAISFDDGITWINNIFNLPIKNIIRIDKETFIFEIINGSNPTYFGVTYDMFMNYSVIPSGTDNISFRMKSKNIITQRPLVFVRNALCIVNQDENTISKIEYFESQFCRLQDSSDKKSVCLFIPNSTGYSVRKYGNEDKYNTTYTEVYNRIDNSGSWDQDVISFNIIKASDNSDCFIITKKDFTVKIDIPTMGIFNEDTYVF